jgi:hypothetical protein
MGDGSLSALLTLRARRVCGARAGIRANSAAEVTLLGVNTSIQPGTWLTCCDLPVVHIVHMVHGTQTNCSLPSTMQRSAQFPRPCREASFWRENMSTANLEVY